MKLCPTCQQCYEDTYNFCASDQTALIQTRQGTRLIAQKYRLDRLLSSGGFNAVYAGTQLETNQLVAIKLLLPDSFANPETLKRFRQEVLVIAHLNTRVNHQHVVKTYTYGTLSDGSAYVVMELVTGQTLREYMDRAGPVPITNAVQIARQVADGLEAAHRCGIVHRALHPSSIILARDYYDHLEVKVVGFGFAKLREQKITSNNTVTFQESLDSASPYIAPERWAGEDLDVRSDIYSLGVILYEMLAGRLPFDAPTAIATNRKHIGEPPPLKDFRTDVPEPLSQLVMHALQMKPAARLHTAAEFARQLGMAEHLKADSSPTVADTQTAAPEPAVTSSATVPTRHSDNGSSLGLVVPTNPREQEYELGTSSAATLSFEDSGVRRDERDHQTSEVTTTAIADAYDAFIEQAAPTVDSPQPVASQPTAAADIHRPADLDVISTPPARHRHLLLYAGIASIILAVGIAASLWFARRTTAPSASSVPRAAMTPAPTPDARVLERSAPEDNVASDTQNAAESLPPANPESLHENDKSQLAKDERAALHMERDKKSASQMPDDNAANPNSFGMGATSASTSKTDSKSTDASLPVEVKTTPEQKPGSDGGCMMSVSESSLSIHNGGSGTVTVNLNGRSSPADITASTSDWSNIVVLSQSQGGKGSGSIRYSIVSVGKSAGTYAVNFISPCGTKRVIVTVK